MKNEDDFLEGLTKGIWTQDAVNAVIAAKAEKRGNKGQTLNCYSLDLCAREDKDKQFNEDNLNEFVNLVHQKAIEKGQPIRFQVAIRVNKVHWTAVDMEVSPEGVKMLNIDAMSDETGINASETIFHKLVQKYPNADQSPNFRFTWLKQKELDPLTGKSQGIQYDNDSCSRFTLDHLFHLSQVDTFALLEQHEDSFKSYSFDSKLKSFDSDTMPREFAFLYRDTQSKTSFNSLTQELKQHVINKKGETLAESEGRHTQTVQIHGEYKKSNQAVNNKKTGYIEDVTALVARDNHRQLIESRDAIKALRESTFLQPPTVARQKITKELIAEAKRIETFKPASSLIDRYHQFRDGYLLKSAERKAESHKEADALTDLVKLKRITPSHKEQLTRIQEEFNKQEEQTTENITTPKP